MAERKQFTPEQEAWIEETLSRSKPPTPQQLEIIKAQFRKAALAAQKRGDSQPSESNEAT